MEQQLTHEESIILAGQIEAIKPMLLMMDIGSIFRAADAFRDQASFERSAAVLNMNYNPQKQELLDAQSEALANLHDFIIHLKKCDTLRHKISKTEIAREAINNLFT